jgi:hypothetical protein
VKSAALIASGYLHRTDPATFEVGSTGSAYDPHKDILYVASTEDNEVFAITNAGEENQSRGLGQLIYRDQVHLHGDRTEAAPPARVGMRSRASGAARLHALSATSANASCAIGAEALTISFSCFYICTFFWTCDAGSRGSASLPRVYLARARRD